MNRIIRFVAIHPAELAAGLRGGEDDVEIKLDYYDDESLPDVIEAFRETLRQIYDTSQVHTEEEWDDICRKMCQGDSE